MTLESDTGFEDRVRRHAALGDPHRLAIVDELSPGDLTSGELTARLGIPGNLLSHHLQVLESAGLIERRGSEGDRRRRYVMLRRKALGALVGASRPPIGRVLFVCTQNSARSQFAGALWRRRTGDRAESAGLAPASRVHPLAIRAAAEKELDISHARPRSYDEVTVKPDLLVSVCDRAGEATLPEAGRHLHWSIPDPVIGGRIQSFRDALAEISERVDALAATVSPCSAESPESDGPPFRKAVMT